MSDDDPMAETDLHDWSNVPIYWDNPPPEGVEEQVRDDIRRSLDGLPAPEDLMFHVVQLTPDSEGPSVTLTGGEPGTFVATYDAVTTWVSMSDWDQTLVETVDDDA